MTCALIWLSLTLSAPAPFCEMPNLSSWPVWQYSQAEWFDRNEYNLEDAQMAFDYCIEHGGEVWSQDGGRIWCLGLGYGRPCFRKPITVIKYDGVYYPGIPVYDCKDTVIELVPETEAEWSVPFQDGTLNFRMPRS